MSPTEKTKTKELDSEESYSESEEVEEVEEILEGDTSLAPQDNDETPQREDPFAHLSLPPIGSDDEFDSMGEDSVEEEVAATVVTTKKPKDFFSQYSVGDVEDQLSLDNAKPLPSVTGGTSASENALNAILGDDLFADTGTGFDIGTDFNDPTVAQLENPAMVGGGFTQGGRATSPRLFAQASQFPSCHQLRVWKWDNGVPLGLGVIDAQATEEDFIENFYDAMPRKGEKKCQYKIRPIDITGAEIAQEKTIFISEHHAALLQLRKIQKMEDMDNMGSDYEYVDDGPTVGSEMTRMFENIVSQSDRRAKALEITLEQERERMRELDLERADERVALAQNAAQGVQVLTERMMQDESSRSERALKMQNEQSQLLLTTLTSVFSQQHSMMAQQSELQRKADEYRIEQERVRAERERSEVESRRQQDKLEYEERLRREQQQLEGRFKEMEETKRWEREKLKEEKSREREDYDRRRTMERSDYERKLKDEQMRIDRDQNYQQLRADREREDFLGRIERERNELLVKMKDDQMQWDRKQAFERDERERRERERKEDMLLRQKQLELQAQKDREHSEKMLQMAMLEREQQREASERRERMDRELRESQERERERRHAMQMREMEMAREKDREHAERMISITKQESQTSNITDMFTKTTGFLRDMGIEPQELVSRMLMPPINLGDGEKKSGWMDNIPKVLGVASELLKSGMGAGMPPQMQQRQVPQQVLPPSDLAQQQMMFQQMQQQQMQQPIPQPRTGTGIPSENLKKAKEMVQPQQEDNSTPSLMKLALDAGINMKEQRKARKAVRNLVRKMQVNAEDKWTELITAAIVEEVAIYTYIKAVSLEQAILETKLADAEFTQAVIKAMQTSDLVPDDLPYTLEQLTTPMRQQ